MSAASAVPPAAGTTVPALVDGRLPLGRWTIDESELKAYAAIDDPTHRWILLDEWATLTDALRATVGEVAACWLSGSFFTDKAAPGDIDCLYIVDRERLMAASSDPGRAAFIEVVSKSQVKATFGLRVDSFELPWWPEPGTDRGTPERRFNYLETRGYWDDFWTRERDADARTSSLPRRGYLEVILDGYR